MPWYNDINRILVDLPPLQLEANIDSLKFPTHLEMVIKEQPKEITYIVPPMLFSKKLQKLIDNQMDGEELAVFDSWRINLPQRQNVANQILLVRLIRVFVETTE